MKLVVLDGYALNPGDNPWTGLEALGELVVYDRTYPDQVLERSLDADILMTNKTVLNRETLSQLKKCRLISVLATGFNIVDIQAAAEFGIPVANVPSYSTDSVAQLTFALILELTHGAADHSRSVLAGDWVKAPDYSYWVQPLTELAGKTIGIVGFGRIGQTVGRIAQAFGMNILAYNPKSRTMPEGLNFRYVTLDELYASSDIVTLHCPLTGTNTGMIDGAALAKMKKTAVIVNTARGALINERDLADALNEGRIAAAALDVLSTEPPKADNPLLTAKNVRITPHIAWATLEARRRLMAVTEQNIRTFLAGNPQNVVNNPIK